jgi:hypothetical protein
LSTSSQNEPATAQATKPLTPEQLAEIRADLGAVPAPPWRWIGVRGAGGPQLVTDHSGRQYLLRAKKPTDAGGDELLDFVTDAAVFGDLEFHDQRAGERYSIMRPGDQLAIGRTDYDPDSIVGVDNPVARWIERSAAHATALLVEVARQAREIDRLKAETRTAEDRVRESIAQDFIRQGEASDSLNWGQAVYIAREGLCGCSGGIKPCDMGGAR